MDDLLSQVIGVDFIEFELGKELDIFEIFQSVHQAEQLENLQHSLGFLVDCFLLLGDLLRLNHSLQQITEITLLKLHYGRQKFTYHLYFLPFRFLLLTLIVMF